MYYMSPATPDENKESDIQKEVVEVVEEEEVKLPEEEKLDEPEEDELSIENVLKGSRYTYPSEAAVFNEVALNETPSRPASQLTQSIFPK